MVQRPEPVRDLDWGAERARGFVDGTADIWQEVIEGLRDRPVARRITADQVRTAVAVPVPDAPMADDDLLAYFREIALDWSMYPGHPGFMAYVSGAGTVPGSAADLLASGLNMNAGGWLLAPAATEIELHLCRWFAQEVFGMGEGAGGELTSGGAMATMIGLKLARDQRAGWDVRREGVAAGPPLGAYLSTETHVVSDRAIDTLGIGAANIRHIEVDDRRRMKVEELRTQIALDRSAGIHPMVVVASAGTVSTGAIDPLDEIADVCRDEGLWLHVDAAYGGPAMLADDLRPQFAGIERADSVAFDPHKWLYTPHSGGCILVRDMEQLAQSFDAYAAYTVQDKEATGHGTDLGKYGPNFSRGFWSLRVWASLLAHGRAAYARRISHDAELARYLGALVQEREDFELCAPVGLSITCFRFIPTGLVADMPDVEARETYLSTLNQRIMTEIQLDGRVFCSNAILDGKFTLRTCIVNFRTEAEDVELVLEVAAELGTAIDRDLRTEAVGA
ncbi:MAG TPA: aminotransferase class V-fold PLP-dependent enzyme [Actinomycetota bacterium]